MSSQPAVAKIETELKFRLQKLPKAVAATPSQISQIYLDIENVAVIKTIEALFSPHKIDWGTVKEARARAETEPGSFDTSYTLTLKGAGDMQRQEMEVALSGIAIYEDLHAARQDHVIEKLRYRVSISGTPLVVEIDLYQGDLSGLVIAEIEFDPANWSTKQVAEMALKVLGPDAVNVTSNKTFKNRELAKLSSVPA
jgi:CYTH domain-containing protein